MKTREAYVWPEEKAKLRRRAIRLEWATLVAMASVVIVLYFVLGSSQAMRTAWTEDILGLVPAAAYLVAVSFERRGPTERFPFGFYRAVSVAYLVGATATLLVGAYLLADNAIKLVNLEHPTIGLMSIAGYEVWGGWVMMAALLYSILPPVVLGRLKLPVARE
ncbi:MAG: cation transporter, partial [Parvibaculaceae bacterium]